MYTFGKTQAGIWLQEQCALPENSKYKRNVGRRVHDIFRTYKNVSSIPDYSTRLHVYDLVYHDLKNRINNSDLGPFKSNVLNILSSTHRQHFNRKTLKPSQLHLVKPQFRDTIAKALARGEYVPREVMYLSDLPPTEAEIARADELDKKYNLDTL